MRHAPPSSRLEQQAVDPRIAFAGKRTDLAKFRSQVALERTIHMHQCDILFAFGVVVLGLAATLLGGISAWFTLRRLRGNETPIRSAGPLTIAVAMMLALVGLGATAISIPY